MEKCSGRDAQQKSTSSPFHPHPTPEATFQLCHQACAEKERECHQACAEKEREECGIQSDKRDSAAAMESESEHLTSAADVGEDTPWESSFDPSTKYKQLLSKSAYDQTKQETSNVL